MACSHSEAFDLRWAPMEARPHKAKAVANLFLDLADEDSVRISPMKIQKLIFFAHGWHMALVGRELIDELVQAWEYGPVIPSVYSAFAEFGNQPISRRATSYDHTTDSLYQPRIEKDTPAAAVIERVWKVYKKLTAVQMSAMAHIKDGPWHQTITEAGGAEGRWIPRNLTIPNNRIREFYKKLAASP